MSDERGTGDADEFVSIAEAARRLSVDPRQIRRYLPRLSDTDRTLGQDNRGGVRTGVRVRLEAIEAIRRGESPNAGGHSDTRTGQVSGQSDRTRTGQGHPVRTGVPIAEDERIEHLHDLLDAERRVSQGERRRADDLNAALERAQSLHLATASELQALRQRAERIEAENRTLRAIEAKADQGEAFPRETAEDRATGAEPVPAPQSVQNRPTEVSGGDTDKAPEPPQRLVGNENTTDPIYRQQEQKAEPRQEPKRRGWWPFGRRGERNQ